MLKSIFGLVIVWIHLRYCSHAYKILLMCNLLDQNRHSVFCFLFHYYLEFRIPHIFTLDIDTIWHDNSISLRCPYYVYITRSNYFMVSYDMRTMRDIFIICTWVYHLSWHTIFFTTYNDIKIRTGNFQFLICNWRWQVNYLSML